MPSELHIVFDGHPAHESGRFVEVETADGMSVGAGEWRDRGNGTWALVLTARDFGVAPNLTIGMDTICQLAAGNAVELEAATLYAASDLLRAMLPAMIEAAGEPALADAQSRIERARKSIEAMVPYAGTVANMERIERALVILRGDPDA